MEWKEAFAEHGVPAIGRSQWHRKAEDGAQVVSIWTATIIGDRAEAHVHGKYYPDFKVGDEVRAVIVQGDRKSIQGKGRKPNLIDAHGRSPTKNCGSSASPIDLSFTCSMWCESIVRLTPNPPRSRPLSVDGTENPSGKMTKCAHSFKERPEHPSP